MFAGTYSTLQKYDSDGQLLWTNPTVGATIESRKILFPSDGAAYILDYRTLTKCFAGDGFKWTYEAYSDLLDFAIAPDGSMYVLETVDIGAWEREYLKLKKFTSDGLPLWEEYVTFDLHRLSEAKVAVNSSGRVMVGYGAIATPQPDVWQTTLRMAMFTQDGYRLWDNPYAPPISCRDFYLSMGVAPTNDILLMVAYRMD